MGLFDKVETHEAKSFTINGRSFCCPVCGHTKFSLRDSLLDNAVASFFGMEWANKRAYLLICDKCGKIEWFLHPPQEAS